MRELGRAYYEALCRESSLVEDEPPPWPPAAIERLLLGVPPMLGAEYAGQATLDDAWQRLHRAAIAAVAEHGGELGAWLEHQSPAWHGIGRVHFHLAENKRDPQHPFAFVATYVDGLDAGGQPLHRTLEHALVAFARGLPASTLQGWLRRRVLVPTTEPGVYVLTDEARTCLTWYG